MTIKEVEQLLRLLKKYSKMGITKVSFQGIELEISQSNPSPSHHRPKRNAKTSKALATKPDGNDDEMTEDEEFEMSQLRINDPEAFEELEIKRMMEHGRQ